MPQLFMKLLSNSGSDRVLEWLRASLSAQGRLDVASSELSLFAFGAAESNLADSTAARLLLPANCLWRLPLREHRYMVPVLLPCQVTWVRPHIS